MTQVKEDEIDILSIFNTLWEGRWKIIATTVTTTLLGLVYIFNLPNIFKVTTPIDNGKPTYFFKYTPINDVLKENKIGYNLTSNTVFEMFLDEFYDYEEMRFVLSQDEEVIKSIKNLDKEKQNKSLTKLAKSFEIIFNEKNYILSYEWNDVEKGSSVFNEAIYIT